MAWAVRTQTDEPETLRDLLLQARRAFPYAISPIPRAYEHRRPVGRDKQRYRDRQLQLALRAEV